jgi:cell division inhibitor SulA
MESNKPLNNLLKRRDIWRATTVEQTRNGISTGHHLLDAQLHSGGWPPGALCELFCTQPGIGEMYLLSPLLNSLSEQGRWLFFVDPPYIPHAAALSQQGIQLERVIVIKTQNPAEQFWVIEQILRCEACGVSLAWLCNKKASHQQLRKLQLAAQSGNSQAFLFRAPALANQPSPASLRLLLKARSKSCFIHILKQPGGWSGQQLHLPKPDFLTRAYIPPHALPVHTPKPPGKAGPHPTIELVNSLEPINSLELINSLEPASSQHSRLH